MLKSNSYDITAMHNLYANFVKIFEITKKFSKDLVNEHGNIPRPGVVPRFSDLEVIALSLTADTLGIDSESSLFDRLREYSREIPNLISRRQFNDRRKYTYRLCETIRKRVAKSMDGGEEFFCVDSKPIEVCRYSRSKRCKMGRCTPQKAPDFGYCASQGMFGDRAYLSAELRQDLFSSVGIRLEVPCRINTKNWKPAFKPFAKARKRIETNFSQLCDQFMLTRNYAKEVDGVFARITAKISAFTFSQYANHINDRPLGKVKYALN